MRAVSVNSSTLVFLQARRHFIYPKTLNPPKPFQALRDHPPSVLLSTHSTLAGHQHRHGSTAAQPAGLQRCTGSGLSACLHCCAAPKAHNMRYDNKQLCIQLFSILDAARHCSPSGLSSLKRGPSCCWLAFIACCDADWVGAAAVRCFGRPRDRAWAGACSPSAPRSGSRWRPPCSSWPSSCTCTRTCRCAARLPCAGRARAPSTCPACQSPSTGLHVRRLPTLQTLIKTLILPMQAAPGHQAPARPAGCRQHGCTYAGCEPWNPNLSLDWVSVHSDFAGAEYPLKSSARAKH